MVCTPIIRVAFAATAICLAVPAVAQNYGEAPGNASPYGFNAPPGPSQAGPSQPRPYQSNPYQPNPYQPAPNVMPQNNGPSLVGTWSGQRAVEGGLIEESDAFSGDGKFVSVRRLANGLIARFWGYYRASPAGLNQLRVEFQLQGSLPRQVCRQAPGYAPQCQPFQVPANDTVLVTFSSPDQFLSVSQTIQGPPIAEARDSQAPLLQVQAPQQWVINVLPPQSAPSTPTAPVVTPYQSPINRGPATNIPGLGGNCDDLQQRRICSINDGALVRGPNGCLVCTGS